MLSERAVTWIRQRGNRSVAEAIDTTPASIRSFLTGRKELRPRRAALMIRAAHADGVTLDYVDFYGDPLTRSTTSKKDTQ